MVLTKWTTNMTKKFISLYKQQVCLWKVEDPAYRDKDARDAALKILLEGMDLPDLDIEDLKKKIKYLRSTYMVELNKMGASTAGQSYTPCLTWFNEMDSFIRPHIRKNTCSRLVVSDCACAHGSRNGNVALLGLIESISQCYQCCLHERTCFNMPRPTSTVWEHFLVLCETDGKKHVTCSYCSAQYKYAMASKLKRHLLKCNKCPNDVKSLHKQNNAPTILHSSSEATVAPPTFTSLTMAPSSSALEPSAVTPLPSSSTLNSDDSHNTTFTTQPTVKKDLYPEMPQGDSQEDSEPEENIETDKARARFHADIETDKQSCQSYTNDQAFTPDSHGDPLEFFNEREMDKIKQTSKRPRLELQTPVIQDIRTLDHHYKEDNEFDIFGKHVAKQLKSMLEEDAVIAQAEIQSILTRYRLKKIRRNNESFETKTVIL